MNPRAGDTVTPTKSKASTTTTTVTTTKERAGRSALRPEAKHSAPAMTRKRRQRAEDEQVARPRPEVMPPPEKSRRRAEPSVERLPSKSRFGDFFSHLASRIRGSKNADTTTVNRENVQSNDSQASLKIEVTEDLTPNVDFNKRRKIENDETVNSNKLKEENELTLDSAINSSEENSVVKINDNQNPTSTEKKLKNDNLKINVDKTENENEIKSLNENTGKTEDNTVSNTTIILVESDTCIQNSKMCENDKNSEQKFEEIKSSIQEVFNEIESQKHNDTDSVIALKVKSTEKEDCHTNISFCVNDEKELIDPETASISSKYSTRSSKSPRKDELTKLRKTIHWLEEGSRRLREDLASVRAELHEERRAAKVAQREFETAIREARNSEATKYSGIISELKTRLSQSPSRQTMDSSQNTSKTDLLKDENHRREVAALKKRLTEAENTIQKLKTNSLERGRPGKKPKGDETNKIGKAEVRKLDIEVRSLRTINKCLEERLHIAEESARARAAELRAQHETHEAETSALQRALRSDTIKMMDELQSKNREIEKLEKLVNESAQMNQKLRTKEDETLGTSMLTRKRSRLSLNLLL